MRAVISELAHHTRCHRHGLSWRFLDDVTLILRRFSFFIYAFISAAIAMGTISDRRGATAGPTAGRHMIQTLVKVVMICLAIFGLLQLLAQASDLGLLGNKRMPSQGVSTFNADELDTIHRLKTERDNLRGTASQKKVHDAARDGAVESSSTNEATEDGRQQGGAEGIAEELERIRKENEDLKKKLLNATNG